MPKSFSIRAHVKALLLKYTFKLGLHSKIFVKIFSESLHWAYGSIELAPIFFKFVAHEKGRRVKVHDAQNRAQSPCFAKHARKPHV
jgi:hypothetical protein